VRGRGDLSAALLALYQGMDAPGTRVEQKLPISVQGKSWLEEEDGKQEWRGSVASTSRNEPQRVVSAGRRKQFNRSGRRHYPARQPGTRGEEIA